METNCKSNIQVQEYNNHLDHFKTNLYMSMKMLCPFLSESEMTSYVSTLIQKLYE